MAYAEHEHEKEEQEKEKKEEQQRENREEGKGLFTDVIVASAALDISIWWLNFGTLFLFFSLSLSLANKHNEKV